MYRHHIHSLTHWYHQRIHKPLILRGARQVGKSTLVRLFAEQQELELVELNFERNPEYAELFSNYDVSQMVSNMRLILNRIIEPGKSLLFLDEIQAAPSLLAVLRYFYEDMPALHVIAAGSLLDFELTSPSFSMPVGRISYLHLYPMDFSEFLHAMGESSLAEFIGNWFPGTALPLPLHEKLMGLMRQNIAVGGMPEAVRVFADSKDYRQVEQLKQDLLATFSDDFSKYAPHQDQALIRQVFRKAPTLIGRKVKYSEIDGSLPSPRVAKALEQLSLARVIQKVVRSAANGLPLAAEENPKFFKLLFLDIGLVSTMMQVSSRALQEDLLMINQGALAEQWVGQALLSSLDAHIPPHLHYWAREARSSSAELDYVIAGGFPVPIEVKAGKGGTLKSLHQFIREKGSPFAVRLNADLPSILQQSHATADGSHCDFHLLSLPLYMAGEVRRIIDSDVLIAS
ncbi:MAG: AAA family ATPase [Mariprofundaceae bacterium]|nr:AAA family ATPase [Mariprofundaceae bacterium]